MKLRIIIICLTTAALAFPVLLDQIAITVNSDLIKDSDIDRDLLATQFENGDPPDLSAAARKKDAAHMIDQIFIREQIHEGDYRIATTQQADVEMNELIKQHYKSDAAFQAALKRYQLTEPDLREQLRWQLTVLDFIDARFRPAVLLTDAQVNAYYTQHLAQLKRQNPKGSEDDLKDDARKILTDERVNKLLFNWLDEQRKIAKVRYLEASLA